MTDSLSEIEDGSDLFYFESDHLAVKGNKEYSELVKTLFILQAQQQRAIKDYEEVEKIKKKCLEDPLETVEKLKHGEDLGIPNLQVIAEIPEINWSNFDVTVPEEGFKMLNCDVTDTSDKSKERNKHYNVSETHNRPWSTEEQKRLEELLLIYPPEPIELRRFKKIAAALGNRTAKQVSSRVQKYFLKLYKAGLPIPGRIPKSSGKYKKSMHKHQRLNHYLFRPTTFFPDLDVPVKMNETEEVFGPKPNGESPSTSHSNYLIPNTYIQDENAKSKNDLDCQVELLKRIKYEKQRLNKEDTKLTYHYGFKCDFCGEEPIAGTRWHCTICINTSIDFCTDCLITQMYSEESHPITHKFAVIRGSNDVAASSSDSESSPTSEKNRASSSSDENVESEEREEYKLSDLGMDDNSSSLPIGANIKSDPEETFDSSPKGETVISEVVFEQPADTSYDYLCSAVDSNFEDTF